MTSNPIIRAYRKMNLIVGAIVVSAGLAIVLQLWPILLITLGLIVWSRLVSRQNKKIIHDALIEENAGFVAGLVGHLGDNGPIFLKSMVAVTSGGAPSADLIQRRVGVSDETAQEMMTWLAQMVIVSEPDGEAPQTLLMDPAEVHEVVAHAKVIAKRRPDPE